MVTSEFPVIVRRGLVHNHVRYAPGYGRSAGLPDWARCTLADHAVDPREHVCSTEQLLAAETDDPHWNDAMREMLATGFMHNYMRMYWWKKILEWTVDPEEAFARTLELNNAWFLDGRDPSSDANGLNRKFDMDSYPRKVRRLEERADAGS